MWGVNVFGERPVNLVFSREWRRLVSLKLVHYSGASVHFCRGIIVKTAGAHGTHTAP